MSSTEFFVLTLKFYWLFAVAAYALQVILIVLAAWTLNDIYLNCRKDSKIFWAVITLGIPILGPIVYWMVNPRYV